MAWKDNLRPASFRGVEFKVELGGRGGGRRIAPHEFPKKDIGYAEDMGRRMRRFRVSGYVIGDDYIEQRDALIEALETEGPGTLVLPTTDGQQVVCEHFDAVESRTRGRVCEFEMQFFEAGEEPENQSQDATQSNGAAAADKAGAQSVASANKSAGSTSATLGVWPPKWATAT